jgi:hypothetical protein
MREGIDMVKRASFGNGFGGRKDEPSESGNIAQDPTEHDRNLVSLMAGMGIKEEAIAAALRISPSTLRQQYAEELAFGHVKLDVKVAANLYRLATGTGPGAVQAAIWWTKALMGWGDRQVRELENHRPGDQSHVHELCETIEKLRQRLLERERAGDKIDLSEASKAEIMALAVSIAAAIGHPVVEPIFARKYVV